MFYLVPLDINVFACTSESYTMHLSTFLELASLLSKFIFHTDSTNASSQIELYEYTRTTPDLCSNSRHNAPDL
jgi:hypothetical protein